jgi:hypothetical protein
MSPKRTSGAKALIGAVFFGTAKAVPFVKSFFPNCRKALATRISAARLKAVGAQAIVGTAEPVALRPEFIPRDDSVESAQVPEAQLLN